MNSTRALVSIALAGLASSVAACSPAPCATCLAVDGVYSELSQTSNVECGGGQSLSFEGARTTVTLVQTASTLGLDALDTHLPGVLHADGSASFGPVPAWAIPQDGSGNTDPSRSKIPGKLYLEGWFTGTGAASAGFEGTYLFISDKDGCEIDARVRWWR